MSFYLNSLKAVDYNMHMKRGNAMSETEQAREFIDAKNEGRLCIGKFPIGAEVWAVGKGILHGRVLGYTRIFKPMSAVFDWNGGDDAEWDWYEDSQLFATKEEAIAALYNKRNPFEGSLLVAFSFDHSHV